MTDESVEPKLTLLEAMDAAALELIKSVNPLTIDDDGSGSDAQPVDTKSRIAAFEAVTAYLATKHKIQPDEGPTSGVDRYRSELNGGAPRRRARKPPQSNLVEARPQEPSGDADGGTEH